MRWRQFLTPVSSVKADKARKMIAENPELQIVDVRQDKEYQQGHIAGAKFIPLASLDDMLDEIDQDKPVLVYCAIGGRSRMAAQLLAGKGYDKVYNLTGGFKAWNGWTGYGEYEQGLDLFMNAGELKDVLEVAYAMEYALGAFYSDMAERVESKEAAELFGKLASIEGKHKDIVAERYRKAASTDLLPEVGADAPVEGGVTTEEYMRRLGTDVNSPVDVVGFAMAMEAQAMDLYSRAAENAPDEESREALERIALEERGHLKHLAKVMDAVA